MDIADEACSRSILKVHAFLAASLARPDSLQVWERLGDRGWTDDRLAAVNARAALARRHLALT